MTDPLTAGERPLILVVDDQIQLRALLQRMLERQGAEVVVASDGVEAVEAIERLGPRVALVLMDIQMPRMTGIEAARRIRALSPDPRIVLMSAQVTGISETVREEIKLYAFLSKPFGRDTLMDMIPADCLAADPQAVWMQ